MMKRVSVVSLLAVFILVPALAAMDLGERDVFSFGDAKKISENEYVVPILVSHDEDLVAMDIPLEYSKGVTLTNISFNDERVGYFDAKMSYIKEDENRAVLGLIAMVYEHKSPLAPGNGIIAELTFRIDDVSLTEFEIKPFETSAPTHKLNLIYNDFSNGSPYPMSVNPEFTGGTIMLSASKPVPTEFSLSQNYPNPFNPETSFAFDLPTPADVNLEIYNILGQRVINLVDEYRDAGHYEVSWNGQDETGTAVASGVYFYRISAGDFKDIKKMVLMK